MHTDDPARATAPNVERSPTRAGSRAGSASAAQPSPAPIPAAQPGAALHPVRPRRVSRTRAPHDPTWYRDAVIYEVHVRAFMDADGNGSGDFRGLTEKLDYLHDLGVTALWLLPFYPSPLRDDGYDIADYTGVHPAYGTLRDVETLIREAHKRGLRVITELVCNHTSDQHPWFQRARRSRPGSPYRDFYVWSGDPDKYSDARIIFGDFETSNWTWDPVAGAYYWHRFYSHQPDLNFDNPRVQRALIKVLDFWLDRGVDGLRLDAVPYLYEREGTDCENLPETHAFLKELRRHVDEHYQDRMLLAEANQWPEQSAAYFGDGDECHMAFNFPVMPRMFMAVRMEDRLPIVDIVEQTPSIPENAQWALFLRNHDELTLEMVTDEERDYMYRVYATDPQARVNLGIRRRLAPLLGNHRRRIELMNGLLFSLPGTPVIYYGDEIGMGDNVYLGDRDSVRTPMQWNRDQNAGFSSAAPERLYLPVVTSPEHSYEAVNVAVQQANTHSLLWWMKRMIALRKKHPAFGRGDLQFLHPDNRHVLAFLRTYDGETILVAANLSRFFQPVELDLREFDGRQPIEMFGRVEFPRIGELPYLLTLGPHEFLWFTLEQAAAPAIEPGWARGAPEGLWAAEIRPAALPVLQVTAIRELLDGKNDRMLVSILIGWLRDRPWSRGAASKIKDAEILDRIEVAIDGTSAVMLLLRVNYSDRDPDVYLLPLTTAHIRGETLEYADGTPAHPEPAGMRIASLSAGGGFLVDASTDFGFIARLIEIVAKKKRLRGSVGELVGRPGADLAGSAAGLTSTVSVMRAGETIGLGGARLGTGARRDVDRGSGIPHNLTLELRRAIQPGPDPETEIMKFLGSHKAGWAPDVYGELEYHNPAAGGPAEAGILRGSFLHEGDLVLSTRDSLLDFFELAATMPVIPDPPTLTAAGLLECAAEETSELAAQMVGGYLETARSIGNRIGEYHAVIASDSSDPAFAPEPFTRLHQASLYQSIDALALRALRFAKARVTPADELEAADLRRVLGMRSDLRTRLGMLQHRRLSGFRIRCHGRLRLDTVMRSERGLVMIDFEGDKTRPASERRLKRSPLNDLASMIRAFHELALGRLRESDIGGALRPEDATVLDVWAGHWYMWITAAFLRGYREATDDAPFLPRTTEEWACLLDAFLLQRGLDALLTDLATDPSRAPATIRGLVEILGEGS
jgi:maltose alpha-D-glucosyltransferase/alpha-amylase